jgi:hypothetical protein
MTQIISAYSIFQKGFIKKGGNSEEIKAVDRLLYNLKFGRVAHLEPFLEELSKNDEFRSLFTENCALVPMPRSAPLVDGAVWPALEISKLLIQFGFGSDIIRCLRRTTSVPKAAFQTNADERPSYSTHISTIVADLSDIGMHKPSRIILLDDVITSGRMAMACYTKAIEAFPDAEIIAFSPIRTMSFVEVNRGYYPTFGTINLFDSLKTRVDFPRDN